MSVCPQVRALLTADQETGAWGADRSGKQITEPLLPHGLASCHFMQEEALSSKPSRWSMGLNLRKPLAEPPGYLYSEALSVLSNMTTQKRGVCPRLTAGMLELGLCEAGDSWRVPENMLQQARGNQVTESLSWSCFLDTE